MKTVGIIAEYNPFHNGHLYQLLQAKKLSGADYAVVVMSGDFTQRGIPALLDKYARCEMALQNGADLVIELPVCYATGSAEHFAKGAIALLDSLHVDALCFGSECGDIASLRLIARILTEEPASFRECLREKLRQGLSFPAARSQAMKHFLRSGSLSADCLAERPSPDLADRLPSLLEAPNNILGIEYLKALLRRNSSMEVYTVARKGAGYLDTALPDNAFASATAIRRHIFDAKDCSLLSSFMPESALQIMMQKLSLGAPVCMDDFSSMLFYRLLSLQETGFTEFADVTEALSDKITKHLEHFSSFSAFCDGLLKSKDLTRSRLDRTLFHILFNIKKQDMEAFSAGGDALYARILGFRESSREIFGPLSAAGVPLLSKLADAKLLLSPLALHMLTQDTFASHLYDSIIAQKTGRPMLHEYRRQIIILP